MLKVFDPVDYTLDENRFIHDHLGEAPIVALRSVPSGCVVKAIREVLETVYNLEELKKHTGSDWVGIPAIKEKINIYIAQSEKWAADKRRGRPRFPSMYAYTEKGRPIWGASGSDSGKVKTYFNAKGERVEFATPFVPVDIGSWTPEWIEAVAAADEPKGGLIVDREKNRIECSVCGHTESFKGESRGSYNAARGRISKHLRTDQNPMTVDRHRAIHAEEF